MLEALLRLPSIDVHIERHLDPWSDLEDLLGAAPTQVQTDRLYRRLDRLPKQKKAIEGHLRQRPGQLFDVAFVLATSWSASSPMRRGKR